MIYYLRHINLSHQKKFIRTLQGVPRKAKKLSLKWNELYKKNGADLAEAFQAIPTHVENLYLDNTHLSKLKTLGSEIFWIDNWPESLDLYKNRHVYHSGENKLYFIRNDASQLAISIPKMKHLRQKLVHDYHPREGQTIYLTRVEFGKLITDASSPPNKHSLPYDLSIALSGVPPHIKKLSLCHNHLAQKNTEELENVFAAIPSTLETINLHANHFYLKPPDEIDRLARALSPKINAGDVFEVAKAQWQLTNIVNNYISYNKTHCFFSLFHRHGKTGRVRARHFLHHLYLIENMNELNHFVQTFISDKKNGNLNPHSLRTMLSQFAIDPGSNLVCS